MAKYMRGDTVRATAIPALVADDEPEDESDDDDDDDDASAALVVMVDVAFDDDFFDRLSLDDESEVRLESSVEEASARSRSLLDEAASEDDDESEFEDADDSDADADAEADPDELESSLTALACGTMVVEASSSVADLGTSVSRYALAVTALGISGRSTSSMEVSRLNLVWAKATSKLS